MGRKTDEDAIRRLVATIAWGRTMLKKLEGILRTDPSYLGTDGGIGVVRDIRMAFSDTNPRIRGILKAHSQADALASPLSGASKPSAFRVVPPPAASAAL